MNRMLDMVHVGFTGRLIFGQASTPETPPTSTTIDLLGSSEKVLVPGVKSDSSVPLSNNASHDIDANDELIEVELH